MNKRVFLLTFILSPLLPVSADTSKHTADYMRGLASEYIGKKISLDVASVTPLHRQEHEDFGFLIASTFDTRNRTNGGKIIVIADKKESLDLVKKYGSTPDIEKGRRSFDVDTLRLTGVLKQTEKKVLFLDVSEKEVPLDILKGLKEDLQDAKQDIKDQPLNGKGKGKPGKKGNPGKGKKPKK